MASEVGEGRAVTNGDAPRFGPILALWMALTVALQGAGWATGFKTYALTRAIEHGAERVESWNVGEVGDDAIRKAIQTQFDTRPFWITLALIGDFVAEPLALVLRAAAVAAVFSGLAALAGRPVRFGLTLAESARVQGFWVLGLAVQMGLMIALRRTEVETSLTLLLPPGTHPAPLWVALRTVDAFALLGWVALARGGWRRGQVNLATALAVCGLLWLGEATLRIGGTLVAEAGMRHTLIPDFAT